MAPRIEEFPASALMDKINTLPSGKARKPPILDLKKECDLREMIQYNCDLTKERRVECKPILRLFRQ
jgi:hypothetical protein